MSAKFECLSPTDGHCLYAGEYHQADELDDIIARANSAQALWRVTPLGERVERLQKACDHLYANREEIGREITLQMGRPIRFSKNELAGLKERAEAMLAMAPDALADIRPDPIDVFDRWITREPLGVVAVLAPWNYPFLTSVNAIIPALAAGNSVILKHSAQTPLVAKRYEEAFKIGGVPDDVFQIAFLDHSGAHALMSAPMVDYVAFTGSVGGGEAVNKAISGKFITSGLELGGKDPAYVREDANVPFAAENLADGAFFNSGQSCCGIERIYAHTAVYDELVAGIVTHAEALVLGEPMDEATTLGPMASAKGADSVRQQIANAVESGGKALLPIDNNWGSAYLAPQVLIDVDHTMDIMVEESFGPVVGICLVADDAEAIELMNDSPYGLTASIWTTDSVAARRIGARIETGTVFLNRCDHLDPYLAWTGVKQSGRGCTLSVLGYEQLTRPKSYNFREA